MLPLATDTFRVSRQAAGGSEVWEPGSLEIVAEGVPGHLSVGSGRTAQSVDASTSVRIVPLALDAFAGELRVGDQVEDSGGGVWIVEFAHLRPLLPHWQATLTATTRS